MKLCEKCGATLDDAVQICYNCKTKVGEQPELKPEPKPEPQPEPPRMKFCSKCGAQIAADAQICMSCGCPVEGAQLPVQESLKKSQSLMEKLKQFGIVKTVVLLVLAIVVIVGSIFLISHLKYQADCKELTAHEAIAQVHCLATGDFENIEYVNLMEEVYNGYYTYGIFDLCEQDGDKYVVALRYEGERYTVSLKNTYTSSWNRRSKRLDQKAYLLSEFNIRDDMYDSGRY